MDDGARIAGWRAALDGALGAMADPARRSPVGQLVKSLISGRTRDEVSLAAYAELGRRFGSAAGIARASPGEVEAAIAAVTFADVKAERLVAALRAIEAERGDLRLDFLGGWPMADALAWLERLPGVGRKTAAAVMNFSTLRRPVMAIDAHHARVLGRLGLGRPDPTGLSERVTAAMRGWGADDFVTFHAQLKRLGQEVCRWDVARCDVCPLAAACDMARGTGAARQRDLFG